MDSNTRVTLQYSISLGELPTEVDRLWARIQTNIEDVAQHQLSKVAQTNTKLSLETSEILVQIKNCLSATMCMVEDLETIVNGYLSYKARPPEETTTAPGPVQEYTPPASSVDVGDLMSKLNAFKQLSGVENEEPHTIEEQEV